MKLRGAIVTAGLTTVAARRARATSGIAPELRSLGVWPPFAPVGPRSLAMVRGVGELVSSRVADGVELSRHDVDGGQNVYVYRPAQASGGALLWIHGGGTTFGRPEIDHALCSDLARYEGILVVSARYRLAPEHPFPAAHDDCYAALRWLHRSADALGVDPRRIAIGGSSAGGGFAAGIAQRALDDHAPVAFQLLLYPMLDDRTTTRATSHRGRLVWTPRANAFAWDAYAGTGHATQELPAYAAPARRRDLAGLPPAWIGVGDLDLFFEEDVDYAQRLTAAGSDVELLVAPGMYHAADYLKPNTPSIRAFRRAMFDAIGRSVARCPN